MCSVYLNIDPFDPTDRMRLREACFTHADSRHTDNPSELLPYEKGGWKKGVPMLKGGRTSFGVVFPRKLEALAILKGGGRKRLSPGIFQFCSPAPLPNN